MKDELRGVARKEGGSHAGEKHRLSPDVEADGDQPAKRTTSEETPPAGELPEATVGKGPKWRLEAAMERSEERAATQGVNACSREVKALRKLASSLLAQALSRSDRADIVFEFPDGSRPFRGHSGVLCAMCEEYAGLFRSGMLEEREGVVRVPPGVGQDSFRGFLEFLYLGKCGEMCGVADGRELAVLSEMYKLFGLREWLVGVGIGDDSVPAAMEFALLPEGDRSDIEKMCEKRAGKGLECFVEASLAGVSAEAA
eukprot:CAMPEP_0173409470 /NCGR_PEP_ID=MMETSP1356-20130122/72233_1 /TAXON_ID=77927 ORGANISM="Hemiselmis virescens, Strain PCC157" /NCGR_SAMPLE_ID=MMETSP1356 /ASSEMBLY_ACC=CAM_ASM_000847 /LENGTH=255 /DNA_ID=CAMNT_0014370941 /DNA_START=73 /DNA_END=836 /DNA_ORIENTATION=+